jgi:hypothetical protein
MVTTVATGVLIQQVNHMNDRVSSENFDVSGEHRYLAIQVEIEMQTNCAYGAEHCS